MCIRKFCRIDFLYFCSSHGHNLGTTYCTCFEDPEATNEEKIGKIEAVCMTTICDSKAARRRGGGSGSAAAVAYTTVAAGSHQYVDVGRISVQCSGSRLRQRVKSQYSNSNQAYYLKVSKFQKHYFLELYNPKGSKYLTKLCASFIVQNFV